MALDAIGARTFRARAGGRARRGPLSRPRDRLLRGGDRASGRTRAPTCGSSRAAGSSWRPASPPRGRATRRPSPRSPPRRSAAIPADVTVVTGDTSRFNWGAGTFASRALVTSGNAVAVAAAEGPRQGAPARRRAARGVAGRHRAGRRRAPGSRACPGAQLTLGALATVANPIRYAYGKEAAEAALRLVKPRQGAVLRDGEEPGLEARGYYAPPQATFASGCHAAIVEVDVETGEVTFRKYVVQHDCGTIVNPTIVEGQIHGGVAQGIGGALYERLAYDEHGQLLAGSFMDFLMPTAAEIPDIEVVHLETPSPAEPARRQGRRRGRRDPGPRAGRRGRGRRARAVRRAGARDAALPDPDPRADRAKRGQASTSKHFLAGGRNCSEVEA